MKRKSLFSWAWLLLGVTLVAGFRSTARSESPLPNEVLRDLAPYPGDPSKLLAASERELYLRGENRSWKRLLSFSGNSVSFEQLIVHPHLPEKIFLLTPVGIMEGDLKTGRSQWIFQEKNPTRNRVHALAIHAQDPRRLYLGTERGLFRSLDAGRSWKGPFRWPENLRIEFVGSLPSQPSTLFLGTPRELFFSKDEGDSFESGFSLPLASKEERESHEEGGDLLEESVRGLRFARFTCLTFSREDPSRLWIGTGEGVFESSDGGIDWERLPDRGLENLRIVDLVFSDFVGTLVAATSRGVYWFHPTQKRWEKVPVGFQKPPTSVALQPSPEKEGERLLIASGSEVLEWILPPIEISSPGPPFLPSPERIDLFRKWIILEPSIREIQGQAIRYGNLGNGKIKRWQWGSRWRALIPRLSFGRDFSRNASVDIDRRGTSDPDLYIIGPDEIDKGWGLDLTWELGDFLYSTAQTSIDARVKPLVELRESILSEVTRIYFERRRVQMEIAFSAPQRTFQEKLDLLLHLDELTAQIDALTGGFLSWELQKINQDHPELNQVYPSLSSRDS